MISTRFLRKSTRLFSTRVIEKPRLTQHFIDGKYVNSISGDTFPTINPAKEEIVTEVQRAGNEDVDRAVEAARKAFDKGPWRKFSGTERGNCILKLLDLFEKSADEIATLEVIDTGRPITMFKQFELPFMYGVYRYNAGWADKIHGDTIPMEGDYFAYTKKEPVGVVAQIIPWNGPMLMLTIKLAPALAAGCTVVIKPAEQSPLSALKIGELVREAGIPDGVVNIINGYGEDAGKYLAEHPGVDKISFTGSSETGLELMRNSAANGRLKRLSLELGGKSPNIICDDVDIDMAVTQAHFAMFLHAGQGCLLGTRTLVHEKIYDEFVEKSTKFASNAKFGDSFDETTTQSALITKEHREKVMGYIKTGQEEGATMTLGGDCPDIKGYYVNPTIFADVKNDMKIAQDEIFGPVMSILKYSDLDEAIEIANDTPYGLAAGVVTKDINKAIYLNNAIRAGLIYNNCYALIQHGLPLGGFKNSGIGREYGWPGIEMYLENKTVVIARPPGSLP